MMVRITVEDPKRIVEVTRDYDGNVTGLLVKTKPGSNTACWAVATKGETAEDFRENPTTAAGYLCVNPRSIKFERHD